MTTSTDTRTPFLEVIGQQLARAQMYFDSMRVRMTSEEVETYTRGVINGLTVAQQIARDPSVNAQRRAMMRASECVALWARIDATLRTPARRATMPLTAAQREASDALRQTAERVDDVNRQLREAMPGAFLAGSVGLVIAAGAGLYVLSKMGSIRVNA